MPPAKAILIDSAVASNACSLAKSNSPGVLNRLVFVTLLALFPLTAIRYGTVEPWWEAALESAIYALGALSVIDAARNSGWQMKGFALLSPFLALAAFAYFQTLSLWPSDGTAGPALSRTISADSYATWLWVLRMLALIIFAELLICYVNSPRRLWILIHILIGVGVLSGLFGITRHVAQRAGYGADSGFLFAGLGPDIGFGQFINQNHFALLMEMTLGLLLGLVVCGTIRRRHLTIYLGVASIVWIALVLTQSRGGIFAMLSQAIFLVFVFIFIRARRSLVNERGERRRFGQRLLLIVVEAMLAALLIVAIIVSVAWVGGDPLARRFERIPNQLVAKSGSREGSRRIDIWRATWGLIKDNKFVGVGFGGYGVAIPRYHDASPEFSPKEAHDEYLELLASGGVIAALIFCWFVVVFVRRVRKCLTLSDRFGKAACLGALAGLCAVAVHSLVDFGLHIPVNAMICMALIIIATRNGESEELPAKDASHVRRYVLVAIAVIVSLVGIWYASRAGLSRWYAAYGKDRGQIASIEKGIKLSPRDPSAYSTLSKELLNEKRFGEAIVAIEHAIVLRPDDYILWLELGGTRYRAGDNLNALIAYQEAVRRAPYYLQPRLDLGHMFFRLGRREEGMAELRRAIFSDPRSLDKIIAFAWQEFGGDAKAVSREIAPQTSAARLQLARFFIQQGTTGEAIALFCAGDISTDDRSQLLAELLAAKKFVEAYSIWSGICEQNSDEFSRRIGFITDGGFEREISLDEQGFGWRLSSDIPTIRFSLDSQQLHSGAHSLSIRFSGDAKFTESLVTQIVLVEPSTHYRLRFNARTEELVTGGPPVVIVTDASADDGRSLAISNTLSQGTTDWQNYIIDFETATQTRAIWISLLREGCVDSTCPIFGRIWVDDFTLQKL